MARVQRGLRPVGRDAGQPVRAVSGVTAADRPPWPLSDSAERYRDGAVCHGLVASDPWNAGGFWPLRPEAKSRCGLPGLRSV
jgi:hypothetical protein